jgi:hypothetical protein
MSDDEATARRLVFACRDLLGDHTQPIVGAVLTRLVADWVASHIDRDGQTELLHEAMLALHVGGVRKLLEHKH